MSKHITKYNGLPFMDKDTRDKVEALETQYQNIINNLKLVLEDGNRIKLMFGDQELSSITINNTNSVENT